MSGVTEAVISLSPSDSHSDLLVDRVVGEFQPLMRSEPLVEARRLNGSVVVALCGDPEGVDELVEKIRTTLNSNRYAGSFEVVTKEVSRSHLRATRHRMRRRRC
jgi:hypothetical protein